MPSFLRAKQGLFLGIRIVKGGLPPSEKPISFKGTVMKTETKENLAIAGGFLAFLAAAVGISVLDEKAGGPEARRLQAKRDAARREALLQEIRERQAEAANLKPSFEGLMDALAGRSSSRLLVDRIEAMDDDYDKRRLLRDWVHSGRRLDPIEAADIRSSFDWIRREDNDLLSVACGSRTNRTFARR